MKRIFLFFIILAFGAVEGLTAQVKLKKWSLNDCIDYAFEHNLQLERSKVNRASGEEDTRMAMARLFPSLSVGVSHNLGYYPNNNANEVSSSGNYGLNSSWTLFDGGRRYSNLKQQVLQDEINSLAVEQSENDIKMALLQAYMQILYATEAVNINVNTTEVAKAQLDRAAELLKAGSISKVDFAQLESQYSSNKYQLVVAQKNLDSYKLQLKQLLELDILDELEVVAPLITDELVLMQLSPKTAVYETTLRVMPEMRSGELSIDVAKLEISKAKAGHLPSISLNAGMGTGYNSGTGVSLSKQASNMFNTTAGLTLSVPIYSNRENKTAVNKAKYALTTQKLSLQTTQKSLLKAVEGIYLDANSAQNQYRAAAERLKYVSESYNLTEEKFFLGMTNTLELLTEKNNLLNAQQEALQSKFMALMSIELLNIYQKKDFLITGLFSEK